MTHGERGPTPPASAAQAVDRRVATLGADRPCTRCGYNLVGQPVVREPTYDLLIVRCPECAAVAALQEYPLLGRWVGRWTMVLAATWLAALLALLLATAGIATGAAVSAGEVVAVPIKQQVWAEFSRWFEAERAAELASAQTSAGAGAGTGPGAANAAISLWQMNSAEVDRWLARWWESHGGEAGYVASKGGWRSLVPTWAMMYFAVIVPLAIALGAVWSVATLGVSRRRLWAIWLLILGAAGLMLLLIYLGERKSESAQQFGNWMVQLTQSFDRSLALPGRAVGLLIFMIGIAIGLCWGRSLARGLASIFLPPRLRWGLAILWTADGLKPPSAT